MTPDVRALARDDLEALQDHFSRHRVESGGAENHFMPFAPNDPDGPRGLDVASLDLRLDERGWQRWFVAVRDDLIVGHVNLKGDHLRAGLHRCELGIGIERGYRGQGLGRRLMSTAITFARDVDSLAWVDLRVFAHNTAGRALYRSLGFTEVGTMVDRFRIEGDVIDDVIMTLAVA